ncbi:MAG TPA: hypothetical protein VIW80_06340 [Pyrinomonadaceae bacterium]|jgi:hypothetical protein
MIKITRRGSQASRQGPAENFTGSVRVDLLFQANAPARTSFEALTGFQHRKVSGIIQGTRQQLLVNIQIMPGELKGIL